MIKCQLFIDSFFVEVKKNEHKSSLTIQNKTKPLFNKNDKKKQ
jgi:hypothetical protein